MSGKPATHKDAHQTSVEHHNGETKWSPFVVGLGKFFGFSLNGDNVKKITIKDRVQAVTKTVLGSFAMARGFTEITVDMNEAAQGIDAEGRKILAEADRLAAEAEALGGEEESED